MLSWFVIALVSLGIVALFVGGNKYIAETESTGDEGATDFGEAAMGGESEITNDPATWPSGDRIWDICRAIAFAEGAHKAGENPDRLNNPGDVSDDAERYGYEDHSGSRVTHFPDKWTGWQVLYDKVSRIVRGGSSVYSKDLTWTEVAQKWAGNWRNWLHNVTKHLGVSPDTTPADYVGGQ